MIGLRDAFVLASTKLRTRKIRTGIVVGVSGILFGLLVAGVVIIQGIHSSVERFSEQGLGARYIMSVSKDGDDYDRVDRLARQPDMVELFEREHAELVRQKVDEARRLGIDYNPESEDPSPVRKDTETGEKYIELYEGPNSQAVSERLIELNPSEDEFDIKKTAQPYNPIDYPSASLPLEVGVTFMKDGKESDVDSIRPNVAMPTDDNPYILAISDGSIVAPFVSVDFDASRGEIPVVIPYEDAEKLLGYEKLTNDVSAEDRLKRVYQVRDRVNEITASFCYRNSASEQLLAEAKQIEKDISVNQSKPGFTMPAVRYKLPAEDSCGPVEVLGDNRSQVEKQYLENRIAFDKKFNNYQDPVQHKITVRGVGISPDMRSAYSVGSMGGLAASLLSSYTEMYWSIPSDMLAKLDEQHRPSELFNQHQEGGESARTWFGGDLVEFGNFEDAKRFHDKYGCMFGACGSDGVMAQPYGSSSLLVSEMRSFFDKAINYAVVFVSLFAMIILAGVIGRTIADGRKESAVFRAIGAKRSDLVGIYSVYTSLLALRVIVFALALGILVAWLIDAWQWRGSTVGAQLAYGAIDRNVEFHFFDIRSPYIGLIVGAILLASLLAMIPPILRAMRRDPIQDMRDDN